MSDTPENTNQPDAPQAQSNDGETANQKPTPHAAPAQDTANEASAAQASAASAQGAPDAQESEESRTAQLVEENAMLKDKLMRTMADMENLRRRTEREKTETAKYAVSNFARDVLSVGDNIDRAIQAVPDEAADNDPALQNLLEGMEMTERELGNILERHGVIKVSPQGDVFDPNIHQAVFEVQNPDIPAGTIAEVMQAGYMIGERVLRPAMVGVAKGGAKGGAKAPKPSAAGEAAAAKQGKPSAEEPKAPEPKAESPKTAEQPQGADQNAPQSTSQQQAAGEPSASQASNGQPSNGQPSSGQPGAQIDKNA